MAHANLGRRPWGAVLFRQIVEAIKIGGGSLRNRLRDQPGRRAKYRVGKQLATQRLIIRRRQAVEAAHFVEFGAEQKHHLIR